VPAIFKAQYEGHCHAKSLDPIQPGESVTYVDDRLVHAKCANDSTVKPRPVTVCQECWVAKPCSCDD
jgi:hypothetical protein